MTEFMPRIFPSLCIAASCLPLHAAVVTSTGFEPTVYSVGNLPTTSSLPVRAGSASIGAQIISSTTPFGGTSNQYLNLNATGTGAGVSFTALYQGVTALSTYHFDLYEPTGVAGSITFGLGASDLNGTAGTGAYSAWTINNGAIGTGSFTQLAAGSPASAGFSEDTHYKAFVLYNGSTSSEILTVPTLGSRTLAAGQTALFFFNMTTGMMADGGIYNTTGTVTPTRFMFRSFSNSRNQIYIDNFTHDNTLTFDAIPEPSSAMLLLGSGSLLLFRRRKI